MCSKCVHLSKILSVVFKHLSKVPPRPAFPVSYKYKCTKTLNLKQISSSTSQSNLNFNPSEMEKIKSLVSENGVVVFTKSTCCLCYVVTILFQELRVNPVVYEIDQDPQGREMEKALLKQGSTNSTAVPAVYINGKLVGSTNEVMSLHLSGSLIPMLKPYQSLS